VPRFSESSSVVLLHGECVVGFYEGSCLWIAPDHRSAGLAAPLILAAALECTTDVASVLPPDVEMQDYSIAGYVAHSRAFDQIWDAHGDLRETLARCALRTVMTPGAGLACGAAYTFDL
jgi:hypothetical protein